MGNGSVSRSPFLAHPISVHRFRVFGEYGFVPNLVTTKRKNDARAILVRYLFPCDATHYQVLVPSTGSLLRCRIVNLQPYNANFDPVTRRRSFMPPPERTKSRINPHHAVPRGALAARVAGQQRLPAQDINPSVLPAALLRLSSPVHEPPRNLRAARISPDAASWRLAYAKELRTHAVFGTFRSITASHLPRHARFVKPVVIFTYKFDYDGNVKGYKARLAFPGNTLRPGYHFDPGALLVYAADRDAVRLVLSIAAQQRFHLFYADHKSAFLHEMYHGPPLYLRTSTSFDGEPIDDTAAVQLHLNIYGLQQDSTTKIVHISQPHLARAFGAAVGVIYNCPAHTPYLEHCSLRAAEACEEIVDLQRFQCAVGVLRYMVNCSRPYLAVITCHLSRHLQRPTRRHWLALRQAARYVTGTLNLGLSFTAAPPVLHAQADAAYADCSDTRRSTFGFLVYQGTNLISWRTQTIKTFVSSTSEAEYITASTAARHVGWLRRLVAELEASPPQSVSLAMDNNGALAVASNTAPTRRSKYIDVKHHLLRDMTARRLIAPFFTPSKRLRADVVTKPLKRLPFLDHRAALRVSHPEHASTAAVGGILPDAGILSRVGGIITHKS